MSSSFGFAVLTADSESWLVRELALSRLPLDPVLDHAEGAWKGSPVTIDTRAYHGSVVRYARFARLVGGELEIGNILCLPDPAHPLPILGADLVALGRETGMLAVDLSPMLPPGPERDAQLAPLMARRSAHPELPPGGPLPDWCAAWFSPGALYTRVDPGRLDAAASTFRDFLRTFVDLVRRSIPRPDRAAGVATAQDGYAAAHRTDDKGLKLLAKMFGSAWADRYVAEVLFPPMLAFVGDQEKCRGRGGQRTIAGPPFSAAS